MLIKGDEKNRGKWSIGVVEQLFEGRDRVVRGVSLPKKGNRRIERAVLLELSCADKEQPQTTLNPTAEVFRPRRMAAQEAKENIKQIQDFETNS